jgi:hypothetical protein
MTLEQTTQLTINAAELQELEALQAAREMREAAIAALDSVRPTVDLCDAVKASIAAGEAARRAIRVIKQRIRLESRRLANIESGFVRALTPATRHQIDCQG